MAGSSASFERGLIRRKRNGAEERGALVIGGDYRGLGIVRSLGRHGIPVWVLADEHKLATLSRYACRSLPWPPVSESQQVEYLLALHEKHGLQDWTLFPTSDETMALIAQHHDQLARCYRLTTPPWDVIRWAYDKRLTYRLAANLGIDHPRTFYPCCRAQVATLDCTFPVILKPAFRHGFTRFTHEKAYRAENHELLLARYDEACAQVPADVVMIQELIPGGGESQVSYAALCKDGQPIASITARRTRQYPMDFGRFSTFVETIDQPAIEEPSRRMLAAMQYTGLVELEFKCDPRDGRYKLLDINTRVWGWHTLGQRAGVDFSYLCWQMLHGQLGPELHARSGVHWVRIATDLMVALQEIRRGQITLRSYLQSLRGPLEFAIFTMDDPLPGMVEVPMLAYMAWRRHAL